MLYPEEKPNFTDIFMAYCDINDIVVTPERMQLRDMIVSQKYTKIVTFHKWGFLRYYFDQLIKEEISFEQFVTIGDIEWQIEDQINPHVYQSEHIPLLQTLTPELTSLWDADTLVILDPLLQSYYIHQYGDLSTDAHIIVLAS